MHTRTPADAGTVVRDGGSRRPAVFGSAVAGFAAPLDAAQLGRVRAHPGVLGVEPDRAGAPPEPRTTRLSDAAAAPPANWGLDRIDQRTLPLDGRHGMQATGAGVTVYVLDTGIDTAHPEFEGRAQAAFNAVDRSTGDCDGHGTVVAGIAASRLHGVAPQAQVRSVKVLDCNGVGLAVVAAGGDRLGRAQRAAAGGGGDVVELRPVGRAGGGGAVAGGRRGVRRGVGGQHRGRRLRGAAPGGARRDGGGELDARRQAGDRRRAPAPASTSTPPGRRSCRRRRRAASQSWSGTSMAAPHVAGVAALYKQVHGDAPSAVVEKWIVEHATPGVVAAATGGTPNRLLYAGDLCLASLRPVRESPVHAVGGLHGHSRLHGAVRPSGQVAITSWAAVPPGPGAQPAADEVQRVGRPRRAGEVAQRVDGRAQVGAGPGAGEGEVRAVGPVVDRRCRSAGRPRRPSAASAREASAGSTRVHSTRSPNRPAPLSASSGGGCRRAARARRSVRSGSTPSSSASPSISPRNASVRCHCPARRPAQAGVAACTGARAAASSASTAAGGTRATNARTGRSSRPARVRDRRTGRRLSHRSTGGQAGRLEDVEAGVRHQRLGDPHRPVGLLPLLQDRHQRAPDRQRPSCSAWPRTRGCRPPPASGSPRAGPGTSPKSDADAISRYFCCPGSHTSRS